MDDDYLSRPRHWDMNFIRNFMLVIGPVSSVFDFLTFYVMLTVFHAGEALFHTGWFIESMATQVLVIFIIRTRRNPFKSRPNPWLIACSLTVVAVAAALPFTPAGVHLGFVAPPAFYGVISYSLEQRTKELGIRSALGAKRSDIVSIIVRQGIGLSLAGVIFGIPGAPVLTRLLRDLLFQVHSTDPPTFIGISMLFVLVALLASYIPARRAAKVDPMVALRYE